MERKSLIDGNATGERLLIEGNVTRSIHGRVSKERGILVNRQQSNMVHDR